MINRNKTDILGIKFDNLTLKATVKCILNRLENKKKTKVYTPNPEIVMSANRDKDFKEVLANADLLIPDGIGIVIASKILGGGIKERVAGFDTIMRVFSEIKDKDVSVFFLGASPGVALKAKERMEQKFHGLNIVGVHDGYFEHDNEVLEIINNLNPDLLLIGLGSPKQEIFIDKYANDLPSTVFIGCGGSFDVMSGLVKRAPNIFIKLHLEWFYRLIKQPSRFIRTLQLPLFLIKVIQKKIF